MSETRVTVSARKTAKPPAPLKIMIIDPNPDARSRLKETVRTLEFVESVSERGSPHSILDILAQNPVQVIMIDMAPGAGDVFEIVKLIRGKNVASGTNFVLLGSDLDEATVNKGKQVGIKGFLQRPYDLASVENALLEAAVTAKEDPAVTRAREQLRDTLDKLRMVSLFTGFTDTELVRLLKICRTRNYKAGTYVFRAGEPGVSLFVLVAGELHIKAEIGGEEKVLVEMKAGDCFGEMAILDAEPRSADAVAATNCTAIEVNESVVNNNEDILSLKLVRQIAILLAKKLRLQSTGR